MVLTRSVRAVVPMHVLAQRSELVTHRRAFWCSIPNSGSRFRRPLWQLLVADFGREIALEMVLRAGVVSLAFQNVLRVCLQIVGCHFYVFCCVLFLHLGSAAVACVTAR